MKTKAILFDFGGTIDTGGVHWYEKFWKLYSDSGIVIDRNIFRDAFSYSEKQMHQRNNAHLSFFDTYFLKISFQISYLKQFGMLSYIEDVEQFSANFALLCQSEVETHIGKISELLSQLHSRYMMAIVSNYYGNLGLICKKFSIDKYFESIIDSAVAGVRKPDPGIFSLALEQLNISPPNAYAIGDSYEKDIAPAKLAGCRTIWLRNKGWHNTEDASSADLVIHDLAEIKDILLTQPQRAAVPSAGNNNITGE
ncbi:MAG: HAD family hydrolase [Bacteroidota bacterium]